MINQEWSRRQFIGTITGAGAAIMLSPLLAWTSGEDDRVSRIVAKSIGIDSHNHVDVPLNKADWPAPQIDLIGELKKSGLSAICMTFAVDYQKLTKEGEAFERFINGLDAMDEALKSNQLQRVLNGADLKLAHRKRKPTIIQSIEGGHFLEGQIERLELAYNRGLRHIGLLHDNDASVPLGDIYTNPPQWGGLTEFGATVIKECNRLGILIDLTHCSDTTINAALKVTSKPVIISHTGLNTQLGQNASMAQMMMPRLISKKQAQIVADTGGLIGVWTHLSDSPLEYAQNIRAMVDVVGVEHVCIGTDTKMTPPYRPNKGNNPPPEHDHHHEPISKEEHDKHNSGTAKKPNRIGERTNEAWKDQGKGFYYAVVDAMLQTGFSEDDILKIGGGNYVNVFDSATAK